MLTIQKLLDMEDMTFWGNPWCPAVLEEAAYTEVSAD